MLYIQLFFSIFLISLINYCYGYQTLKVLKIINAKFDFFETTILGFFFLATISLVINFFSPINLIINNFILVFGFIIFFFNFFKKNYDKIIFFNVFLISLISVIVISFSYFQEDYPWYSIPYISLINNEKISFGISNVQFRFGHISLLQYSSAILPNFIIKYDYIFSPNLILFICFAIWLLKKIFFYYKNTIIGDLKFSFLFFISIFIFTKFTRFSEYGNDVPAHSLAFLTIYYFIGLRKKIANSSIIKIIVFSTFAILQKTQYLFIALLPIYILLSNFKYIKKNSFIIGSCLIIFILWSLKTFINTSCFLYPSEFSCFNVLWAPFDPSHHSFPEKVFNESSAWSKGWSDQSPPIKHYNDYINNYNWLKTWVINHGVIIFFKIIPYLFISLIFLIFHKKNLSYKSFKLNLKDNQILLLILIINIIIWFNIYPIFRYNSAIIIAFFSIIFSCLIKINRKNIFRAKILILVCLVFFIGKNITRIIENRTYHSLIPKIYNENGFDIYKSNNNTIFAIKPKNGPCLYTNIICSHHGHLDKIETTNFGNYKLYKYKE